MSEATAVLLETRELNRTYTSPNHPVVAVDDVSFQTTGGEYVAVMGPSGSGKTTLLNLLSGLDRPTRGFVRFRDRNYAGLNEAKLAALRLRHIGLVFQDVALVNALTALDNVRLPLLFDRRLDEGHRAAELLARLGLESRCGHLPGALSRGEAQRVGIARALVARPELLIADEPTGNLDSRASREIFEIFGEVCRRDGVTVVVATHDETVREFAGRGLRLRDGRIVADETWNT